jgi:hypothetical protein
MMALCRLVFLLEVVHVGHIFCYLGEASSPSEVSSTRYGLGAEATGSSK